MIALSYFDGHSCGQIALIEQGIPIEKYYACETDKFTVEVIKYIFSFIQ